MREVELAICFNDGTWHAGYFAKVPTKTRDEDLESVASEEFLRLNKWDNVAHIWVYNSQDETVYLLDDIKTFEVAIALANGNWYDGVMVDIPGDTPDSEIRKVVTNKALEHPALHGEEVSHVWILNAN